MVTAQDLTKTLYSGRGIDSYGDLTQEQDPIGV